MKDSWVIGFLSVTGVLLMAGLGWQVRDRLAIGSNDFASFYAGARLLGTPDLYNADRAAELQRGLFGATSDAWRYIRLPFHAAFLWPLAQLPYRAAYVVWELLLLAAFAGFIRLWRPPSQALTLLYSCLSLPAFASVMNGQDLTPLLLCVAIGVSLERRARSFAAGAVFSLCAAKFHLFVLLPVLLVAQKRWRFLWGLLAGGVVLAALSFAVQGPSWPLEYYAALLDQRIHPRLGHMPNLRGISSLWPPFRLLEWPLAAGVAVAAWVVARRMPFDYALAAVLAGGLLVSYHSSMPDCALLLPAALVILSTTAFGWLRFAAFVLLVPLTYFLLLLESPLPALVPATIGLFLSLMVVDAQRQPAPVEKEPEPMRAAGAAAGG